MLNRATTQYIAALPQSDTVLLKLLSDPNGAHKSIRPEEDASADLPVDWEQIIERAAGCSLTPLLFGAIRDSQWKNEIPVDIFRKLQGDYQVNALHNMLLYRKLHTILRRLYSHAIDVIPIKGIFLAQIVYQDIGLRPMSDIDLLIRAKDRATVLSVMAELGFRPGKETDRETDDGSQTGDLPRRRPVDEAPDEHEKAKLPRERHHDRLTDDSGVFSIEIHWALVKLDSPFQIDYDPLWQRVMDGTIAGIQAHLLSPVDTLLHLCIHLCYQHVVQHYTLRGLCDIQRLIIFYGNLLDWPEFCRLSEEWRAQRSADLALFLANALVEADVPQWVLQRLQAAQMDERLPRWAIDRALGYVDDSVGPWSGNTARWHLATRWSQKALVAYQACFPPPHQLFTSSQARSTSKFLWVARLRHWTRLARLVLADRSQLPNHISKDSIVSWREREIGRTALTTWLHEQQDEAR